MNIKEIFDKSEGGTMTYEQFVAAATEGKAKFVDLAEGGYVDKQKYTDDLSSRDTRITSLDESLKARDTDLEDLKKRLETAGADSDKLGELNNSLSELQKKYDKDTKALEKQMKDQSYKHAVMDFANQQKFTSQAAKRDFVNSMTAKNLQMENDVIIGATDFVTAYKNENSDAFVVDVPNPEGNPKPQPHFVEPTSPQGSNSGEPSTPFNFNFTGVRPHE